MILKTRHFAIATLLSLAAIGAAHAYDGQALQKDANISPATARQIALNAQPGTVAGMDLEREAGGSGLRYSFDIRTPGRIYKSAGAPPNAGDPIHEVGVDAKTGAVLENHVEGSNPD
ncbi:MAG TPA: PepSY domain-containing protein [Acidiphilium sp.]